MRFCGFIFFILLPISLLGQMTAPGSKSVRYTSYPSSPSIKDSIFFYCNATGTERGTLTASSPGGNGLRNFTWLKWNDLTSGFNILVNEEMGVTVSTVTNLNEGGYKVDIDSAGILDTSLIGWIFFDLPPKVGATLANPMKHCYYVALDGDTSASVKAFYYRDIVSGLPISLKNELTFLWSSTPASVIPLPNFRLDPISYTPPLEDVTYKLEVNSLGCTSDSAFFYESIHVKADFEVDPVDGEAPLEVTLTDKSIRGYTYEWDFGDDTISHLKDPGSHIYYKPGEYWIKLSIESELFCNDNADSIKITVEPSKLDIPNVFTPDDDGYNDRFRIESKSLRFVSMEVFSQSGLKVYGFSGEGENLKNWDGWDGNINNSSTKARPGVYFYIIRAFGWDDEKYDSKAYRGFVYLYR